MDAISQMTTQTPPTRYLCFEADGSLRFSTLETRLWVKDADDNVLDQILASAFNPVEQTIVRDPSTGALTVSQHPPKS